MLDVVLTIIVHNHSMCGIWRIKGNTDAKTYHELSPRKVAGVPHNAGCSATQL